MNILLKRKEHLEDNLSKDYDLRKQYEDKLRLEDEPIRKANYSQKIEEIKKRIESNETEFEDVSRRLQKSETVIASSALQKLEYDAADAVSYGTIVSGGSLHQTHSAKLTGLSRATDFLPPPALANFVGGEQLIEEIRSVADETRFVVLTGISGIGKTSLLKQLAAASDKNKTLWYEFVPGLSSLEDLLLKLARFVDSHSEAGVAVSHSSIQAFSIRERIELLIDELNKDDYRIFFDDFEAAAKATSDEEIKSFFPVLKKRLQKGIVFIASEDKPRFFTLADENNERTRFFNLEGLSAEETILYFKQKNIEISAETAEKLDEILGGMPLALDLLVNSVEDAAGENELLEQAEAVQERVVEELFEAVYKKLDENERNLLTTAALLALPFSKQNLLKAHRAVFQKNAAAAFISLARRNLISSFSPRYYKTQKTIDSLALAMAEINLKNAREVIAEHFLETLPDDYVANLESLLLFAKAENYNRAVGVASDLIDRHFLVYDLAMAEKILAKLDDKDISPENRVWFWGDKGLVAQHLRRFDESAKFYNEMLALAIEIENKRGEALALHRLGALYWQMKEFAPSKDYYRRSLELKIELEDYEGQAQLHNNLGLIYSDEGDVSAALAEYETGLELRRKADTPEWCYLPLYSNLGILYAKQEEWEKAFEFSNKALKIAEDLESPYDIAKSLYNLGKHESTRGDEKNAREKFFQVLETAETYNIDELEELSCTALGRSYGDADNYEKAISYFERLAQIYERYNDRRALARIVFDIGTYQTFNGDYQAALKSYSEGIELFGHLEERLVKFNLNNLCSLAGKLGDGAELYLIINALKLLRRKLARQNPTPRLAHVCDALSAVYLDVLNNERGAIAYLRGRLKTFERLDSKRESVKAWLDLGLTYEELEKYKYALDANENALKIIESESLSDLFGIGLYNTGNICAKAEMYDEAEDFYKRAEAEAITNNDTVLLNKVHHNLGETYSRAGRPEQAVVILKNTLEAARKQKDWLEIVFTLNSLGLAYEDLEEDTEALTCWHEAVELCRQHDFGREEANTLISIGNFYLKIGKFDSAKNYYEQSYQIAIRIKNVEMEEAAMLSLAVAHRSLGSFSEIEKDFTRIAERAGEMNHHEHLTKFLAVAGAVNLDEGEIKQSVEMFEKAFLFAYWRIIEFAAPFISAGAKMPLNMLELPFVFTQLESSLERAVESGKTETAQTIYRALLDALNNHKIWREENFIRDLLKDVGEVFLENDANDD